MEASEKASVASRKAPRRILFTFCNLLRDVRDEIRKPKPWVWAAVTTKNTRMLNRSANTKMV